MATTKKRARSAPKSANGNPAKMRTARPATKRKAKPRGLGKLAERMRGIDLCMMTTVGRNGALHARPMSNNGEVDFDGDAWFFSSRSTKTDELRRDDRVNITYVGGSKRAPVWISVSGRAEVVTSVAKKKELWLKELERWFDNGPEDADVVLIHVKAERASWWSYDDEGSIELA